MVADRAKQTKGQRMATNIPGCRWRERPRRAPNRIALQLTACAASILVLAGCPRSDEADSKASSETEASRPAAESARAPARGKPPKHVILISLDTVRADHMSCYGYERPTTPRLDAFARRGALFLNCTSPSAWTIPSHMSIFTGLEPPAHRCIYYRDVGRINPEFVTMQRILSRHGFRTGAFTGGGYMSERYGLFAGFDTYSSKGKYFQQNLPDVWKWIATGGEEPMFLFVHGFDAHKMYWPPAPYRTLFAGNYQTRYPVKRFCKPGAPKPGPLDLEYIVSLYDGEIRWVDDTIAGFLDALEQRGILEESLVIITTDHGDEFFDHGRCDHIHSLYDELVRAAWIMVGPSIPQVVVHDHVGTLDILPTVLEVLGIESDLSFQGVSRVNALTPGDEPRDADVFSFTGMSGAPYHLSSVRTLRWKLITDLPCGRKNKHCPLCLEDGHKQVDMKLFDLQSDPGEQYNLIDEYPELALELLDRIQQRIAESRALARETIAPPAETEENLERLRSLGYIE
jgi:arylsulfatase A-like enzyme